MAIPKVAGGKKLEFTPLVWGQLAGGAACVIVALILGWVSFAKWRFKALVVSAYEAYDQGQISTAKKDVEDAIGWNKEHPGALELLAKIECDGGKADKALAHYKRLQELNHDSPTVTIGMAVLALKAADRATNPKDMLQHLKTAQAWFAKAGGVPESQIGLGHCELLLARRLNDPKRYESARTYFQKLSSIAGISIAGAADYKAGLGASLGASNAYDPASAAALRSWYQYNPRSHVPFATLLSIEVERFRRQKPDANAMAILRPQGLALSKEMKDKWRAGRDSLPQLQDPWIVYTMEFARALAHAGDLKGYEDVYKDVIAVLSFEKQTEPALFDVAVRMELALKETEDVTVQDKAVTFAVPTLGDLVRDPRRLSEADDASKDHRARLLNLMGWVEAWKGGYDTNAAAAKRNDESALNRLKEALKAAPDDYVYNRNLAVLLKRLKLPEKEREPHVQKAQTAAAASKEFSEDFARVQQYLAGN